ncbi:hypothetical protein MKW94_023033, partial [Papaver nudicaule]|nr:hypothetical protein [Papaver nudicaule]
IKSLLASTLLLGRLYYDKGGNSKWLATFVQSAGFPILLFNAILSFFLNSLNFFPCIFNYVVLLTILASLLAADTNYSDTTHVSKGKYVIGFFCTLAASAGYSLWLSLTQLAFKKVIKKKTITSVLEMQILLWHKIFGLFASGDWKGLKTEMNEYTEGKVPYVMTLVWTAITWQIFSVGTVGLIFESSSMFSNVASTLGLPIVPILAVIFFHEKLSGIKVVAILLSLWGFISYVYQFQRN